MPPTIRMFVPTNVDVVGVAAAVSVAVSSAPMVRPVMFPLCSSGWHCCR